MAVLRIGRDFKIETLSKEQQEAIRECIARGQEVKVLDMEQVETAYAIMEFVQRAIRKNIPIREEYEEERKEYEIAIFCLLRKCKRYIGGGENIDLDAMEDSICERYGVKRPLEMKMEQIIMKACGISCEDMFLYDSGENAELSLLLKEGIEKAPTWLVKLVEENEKTTEEMKTFMEKFRERISIRYGNYRIPKIPTEKMKGIEAKRRGSVDVSDYGAENRGSVIDNGGIRLSKEEMKELAKRSREIKEEEEKETRDIGELLRAAELLKKQSLRFIQKKFFEKKNSEKKKDDFKDIRKRVEEGEIIPF